jgi:hypothetical protein
MEIFPLLHCRPRLPRGRHRIPRAKVPPGRPDRPSPALPLAKRGKHLYIALRKYRHGEFNSSQSQAELAQ